MADEATIARIDELEQTLHKRIKALELLLHGEPDPHAVTDNHNLECPRPEPPPLGLIAKIERLWRFAELAWHPGDSIGSKIYDEVKRRFLQLRREEDDRRDARTVRGRVRALAQRVVDATYPTSTHDFSNTASVVSEAGLGSLGED